MTNDRIRCLRRCRWLIRIFLFLLPHAPEAQIYVSVGSSDQNDSSIAHAKATLHSALREVRNMRRVSGSAIKEPVRIIIDEGDYRLSEPVFIRSEDSGTEDSPTIIEGRPGAKVILNGGLSVSNWKRLTTKLPGTPVTADGNLWVADLPEELDGFPPVRHFWVNGVKAVKARWPNEGEMKRIVSWNKQEETCVIPHVPLKLSEIRGMEMFILQWWENAVLRMKKMEEVPGGIRLHFKEPESRIQSEHPWPPPSINEETGNSAFYLTNLAEFLDEPGEWWVDHKSRKIYYWPREGEDMETADAVVPLLENIIRMEGSPCRPVSHVHFRNISFQYTGWNRPSLMGHVPMQIGMPIIDAYELAPPGTAFDAQLQNVGWIERPAAAVLVRYAEKTSFQSCNFSHFASTGLDYREGTKYNVINGNLFEDIGGSGILTGIFSDEAVLTHRPYIPEYKEVIVESNRITNNFIFDVANEDWGCVGIGLGFVRDTYVAHNEIANLSYTGISLGWGWHTTPNIMRNNQIISNKIHHFGRSNYDGGGIYTLSAQPGTVIAGNYIDSIYNAPYAHKPFKIFYLYTDEGSSGITVENNWTPRQRYFINRAGEGNVWKNNGPQVDEKIKLTAGLEDAYRHLLTERTARYKNQIVNSEYEKLIELIPPAGTKMKLNSLRSFMSRKGLNPDNVYRWKNRYVIFDIIDEYYQLIEDLKKEFPEWKVRPYYDAFYLFDRNQCDDKPVTGKWKHIIMTVNLISDEQKQDEYFRYHRLQSKQWPEVSAGFCHAGFQRILMFRRGRQLMMMISIPENKSLAEINPKANENNPRMDEWNRIMATYQESPDGVKGKTWVEMKRVR